LATTRWATRPARRTTRAGAAAGRRALALRDANFAAPGAATAETVKALMSSVARRGQRARCAAASRVAFWINSSTLLSESLRFRFRARHTGQPDRFSRSSSKKGAGCAFRRCRWHSLVLATFVSASVEHVQGFNVPYMPPGPPLRARAAHAPRTRVTGQREREACPSGSASERFARPSARIPRASSAP